MYFKGEVVALNSFSADHQEEIEGTVAVAVSVAFIWLIPGPQGYLLSCRSVILVGLCQDAKGARGRWIVGGMGGRGGRGGVALLQLLLLLVLTCVQIVKARTLCKIICYKTLDSCLRLAACPWPCPCSGPGHLATSTEMLASLPHTRGAKEQHKQQLIEFWKSC